MTNGIICPLMFSSQSSSPISRENEDYCDGMLPAVIFPSYFQESENTVAMNQVYDFEEIKMQHTEISITVN